MSDKPSEYLKRTCLICGCHTNQTINIYEPRSGPNIVQLIQAKFKFQPLNEDKYLCFSCNNWLINWHSLQALNSNDAESPSGTFRSHLNNMDKEKGAKAKHSASRPIAQVRPRQLLEVTASEEADANAAPMQAIELEDTHYAVKTKWPGLRSKINLFYSKRNLRLNLYRLSKHNKNKSLQTCCICGRAIVLRIGVPLNSTVRQKSRAMAKCRKCREVSKWRAYYVRSLAKAEQIEKSLIERNLFEKRIVAALPQPSSSSLRTPVKRISRRSINNTTQDNIHSQTNGVHQAQSQYQYHRLKQQQQQLQQQQQQCLKRPLVDGKVVAMLRRLGTTLSRENAENDSSEQNVETATATTKTTTTRKTKTALPSIMSPAKQRPRWTRQLEDDEILLDFHTAISEVFPIIDRDEAAEALFVRQTSRRKLTYQVSAEKKATNESDIHDDTIDVPSDKVSTSSLSHANNIYDLLPKGLSVSLV